MSVPFPNDYYQHPSFAELLIECSKKKNTPNSPNIDMFVRRSLLARNSYLMIFNSINSDTVTYDVAQRIAAIIPGCINLKSIEIRFDFAKANSFDIITKALGSHPNLREIKRLEMRYSRGCAESLQNMLQSTTSIKALNLSGSLKGKIPIKDVRTIAEGLKNNHSIQTLTLGESNIQGGFSYLLDALKTNTTLQRLTCQSTQIALPSSGIVEALTQNTTLTHLTFNNIKSNTLDWSAPLFQSLQHNTGLTVLDLSNCPISPKAAQILGIGLLYNTSLTHLDLISCLLSDECLGLISSGLGQNSSLLKLNLTCNNITPVGMGLLSSSLMQNTTLTHLILNQNQLGSEGVIHLNTMLKVNNTIRHLEICENNLHEIDLQNMASTLEQHNYTLVETRTHNAFVTTHKYITQVTLRNKRIATTLYDLLLKRLNNLQHIDFQEFNAPAKRALSEISISEPCSSNDETPPKHFRAR